MLWINSFRFTKKSNGKNYIIISNTYDSEITHIDFYVSNGVEGNYSLDNMMVIEYQQGMENWDIPYFEGMQSVQMPVLTTTGKNLFDLTGKVIYSENNLHQIQNNEVIMENTTYGYYNCRIQYFNLKPNERYIISYNREVLSGTPYEMVIIQDENRNTLDDGTGAFTAPLNGKIQILFYSGSSNKMGKIRYYNIQIEEDSTATPYEPFKSITLSTPSDLELRKVGEVQDEMNVMTGEVVERVGEIVLDGSEGWQEYSTNTINTYCGVIRNNIINDYKGTIYLNDKLAQLSDSDIDSEGIRINSGKRIFVRLNRNKRVTDLATFKQYLSQNPITIQYELATPTTKTVDLTIVNQDGNETKLRTFDETTHVLLNSEGVPMSKASLTVRTKIPSASSTNLLMDDISTNQQQLESTVDEQSNNVDATMIATTEIYEETL